MPTSIPESAPAGRRPVALGEHRQLVRAADLAAQVRDAGPQQCALGRQRAEVVRELLEPGALGGDDHRLDLVQAPHEHRRPAADQAQARVGLDRARRQLVQPARDGPRVDMPGLLPVAGDQVAGVVDALRGDGMDDRRVEVPLALVPG
jgi:hypothetical protein